MTKKSTGTFFQVMRTMTGKVIPRLAENPIITDAMLEYLK